MRSLLVILTVLLGAASIDAQTVSRHTILFHGKASGQQTTTITDGSKFSVDFSYRDNGRGPDIKEEFSIGNDGILRSYTAQGTSTFGAAITESFTLTDGKAEWKSLADQG